MLLFPKTHSFGLVRHCSPGAVIVMHPGCLDKRDYLTLDSFGSKKDLVIEKVGVDLQKKDFISFEIQVHTEYTNIAFP